MTMIVRIVLLGDIDVAVLFQVHKWERDEKERKKM